MIRLLLVRHAKAVAATAGIDDFDRALAPRGHRDAALLTDWMIASDMRPRRVLCSAARRTRETLAGLLPTLADDGDVHLTRDLYEARPEAYLATIARFGETASPLLVIGHNPAIHQTALALVGDAPAVAESPIARSFPTAALAAIDVDIADWRDLAPITGHLAGYVMARDLARTDGDSA